MTLENGLALIILIGRLGDVLSTLFVTPNLVLEGNPVVRRFKWPTMVAGFAFCLVPYFDVHLAVMVAVPSLLITASNLTKGWMARALGEQEVEAIILRAAARGSLATTLTMVWTAALFVGLAASLLFWLSWSEDELALYFALGLLLYGLAIGIHSSFFFVRVFRRARSELPDAA
jgi:preprotein translocase subunit SecF